MGCVLFYRTERLYASVIWGHVGLYVVSGGHVRLVGSHMWSVEVSGVIYGRNGSYVTSLYMSRVTQSLGILGGKEKHHGWCTFFYCWWCCIRSVGVIIAFYYVTSAAR